MSSTSNPPNDIMLLRPRHQHQSAGVEQLDVITGYKGQAQVEGGFRFLKDPLFFVSSLFVKNPVGFKVC